MESSFQRFKQWRDLATRCDKLASTYRAAVLLRALLWLPALADASWIPPGTRVTLRSCR